MAGVQAQVRPAFGQQAFQFFLQLGGQALQRGHQPRIGAEFICHLFLIEPNKIDD
ncbi:Uncharacterised protein [Bordetella pertussis]|nr:Uncharacterised protein [Bordetella pertussis]